MKFTTILFIFVYMNEQNIQNFSPYKNILKQICENTLNDKHQIYFSIFHFLITGIGFHHLPICTLQLIFSYFCTL